MKAFKKFMALCLVMVMALTVSVPVFAATGSYSFKYGTYSRKPGQSIGTMKSKWKLKEISRKTSCAGGNGQDVTYSRSGLKVYATSKRRGGTEYISKIVITSSSYKTREGVKVGSTLAALKAKYSNARAKSYDSSTYTASKSGVKITFKIRSGKVRTITYTK